MERAPFEIAQLNGMVTCAERKAFELTGQARKPAIEVNRVSSTLGLRPECGRPSLQ